MKNVNLSSILSLLTFLVLFSGCSVIGDIFEAGMWVGLIGTVLVVVFVIWVIRKLMG